MPTGRWRGCRAWGKRAVSLLCGPRTPAHAGCVVSSTPSRGRMVTSLCVQGRPCQEGQGSTGSPAGPRGQAKVLSLCPPPAQDSCWRKPTQAIGLAGDGPDRCFHLNLASVGPPNLKRSCCECRVTSEPLRRCRVRMLSSHRVLWPRPLCLATRASWDEGTGRARVHPEGARPSRHFPVGEGLAALGDLEVGLDSEAPRTQSSSAPGKAPALGVEAGTSRAGRRAAWRPSRGRCRLGSRGTKLCRTR